MIIHTLATLTGAVMTVVKFFDKDFVPEGISYFAEAE